MASITAEMLVHKQLQDVLLTQRQVLQSWKEQMRIDQDTVSKLEYDELVEQLKEERRQHEETKARLASESDKLQFALGEIEVLSTQLEREKANFEQSFGQLKEKSVKDNAKASQLKTRFSAIETEKQKQDDLLSLKESKIRDLKQRLAKQKDNHRQQVQELNVQLQQEAYIVRTLSAKGSYRRGYSQSGK
ncbi:spermatogenesis-associated protein 24-like isoform X2 [Acanthaster planci]|uniref:Spermatogenesis-associated protein 24-like isoform X2 n=1 Tax=Acanthaster planci TaxID=133434 RepID=A0A8B7YH67_ACAPL|nr:spermatogenesis-associated protein 24-like isoform X2 [Acanthaster planci]